MTIIVGLGNPGKKFDQTRRNVGFMIVDAFAKEHEFAEFELLKKFDSLVAEKGHIVLAKPQTFMNESGRAAREIMAQNKKAELIVIHDDIDLPLGTMKIIKNRGSAGHNGVESIIQNIGNENVIRFRAGIQPATGKPEESEKFVIKKFTKEELPIVQETVKKVSQALDYFMKNGLEKTMNQYNQ